MDGLDVRSSDENMDKKFLWTDRLRADVISLIFLTAQLYLVLEA